MILTAAFIISKAIGAIWSWWWLISTVVLDCNFNDQSVIRIKLDILPRLKRVGFPAYLS